jgi:hypothetical protein
VGTKISSQQAIALFGALHHVSCLNHVSNMLKGKNSTTLETDRIIILIFNISELLNAVKRAEWEAVRKRFRNNR